MAEALVWLGRYDEAEAELAKAGEAEGVARLHSRLATFRQHGTPEEAETRCVRRDMDKATIPATLIGDCTLAFLNARTAERRGYFLTVRSTAWLIAAGDRESANADLRTAAGIDPDNPDRHINYGYGLLAVNHSWAARNEFELALSREKHWLALAGRAQANYNLGSKEAAFDDAKASFGLHADNPAALSLLGDLAMDGGNKDMAKAFWLGAYGVGLRDDDLIRRLKSVGVDDPAAERKAKYKS